MKIFLSSRWVPPLALALAWVAVTWVQPWDLQLKMDAMTYAALAKNILATGDWLTLHYGQQAYVNFYQHPPLTMWIQAVFFRILGISDVSARVLPGLFALGSIFIVYRVGGYFSALVLILTPKFIKYGADFYLDGPLAFWMILYAACALKSQWIGMAIGFAAAFMTKGLVAFVLPVMCLAMVVWDRKQGLPLFLKSTAGAIFLVSLWLVFGNGIEYLREYWSQSVAGRTRAASGMAHLQPLLHLLLVYFPWWVGLGYGYARAVKAGRKDLAFLSLGALGIVGGFSIVGHAYEHYFLPFYVFAAPVVGFGLSHWLKPKFETRAIQGTFAAAGLVLLVNVLPIRVHQTRNVDLAAALNAARDRCHGVRNVHVATDANGHAWPEMAYIQWKTNWQTVFDPTHNHPNGPRHSSGILVTPHTANAQWKRLGTYGNLNLYEPASSGLCRF